MLSPQFLMMSPILWLLLLGAPGCATPASPALQTFPHAELLAVDPKPLPSIDILTSAQAAAKHNIAVEMWGQAGWDRVKSLCLWAKERGMTDAPC